jgi:hypothetical protein
MISPISLKQALHVKPPVNEGLRLVRRCPETLPKNKKLISAPVSIGALIRFIESQQTVMESIPNALFIRAP